MSNNAKQPKPRGFAAMSPEKRAEAGRKGGQISKRGSILSKETPDWKITIEKQHPVSDGLKYLSNLLRKVTGRKVA